MKRFALSTVALACQLAYGVDAQPNTLTVELAPGNTASVTRRPSNTSRTVQITANKGDRITVTTRIEMHGGLNVDTSDLPPRNTGTSEFRVRATTEQPSPSTAGAFRTVCNFSHFAFDDSLVYPGFPGKSHLHIFFGNTGSDSYSDDVSIRTTGNSTCRGGIANRSSYWASAVIDIRTSKPLVPDQTTIYYKNGAFTTAEGYGWKGSDGVWHEAIVTDPASGRPMRKFPGFTPLPVGLRLVMGNPNRTTPRTNSDAFDYRWTCQGPKQTFNAQIPTDCPVGSYIEQEIFAPQCWDGKNLDSPDHKSHMAYTVNVKNVGDPRGWSHQECPATHPVVIPSISLNLNYNVTDADGPKNWRLVSDMYDPAKPAGYSSHGDYRNGWDASISDAWLDGCIRAMKDCHAHLLGDGREMY